MEKVRWSISFVAVVAIILVCAYYTKTGIVEWVQQTKLFTAWGNAIHSFGIREGMIFLSVYITILFTPKRE